MNPSIVMRFIPSDFFREDKGTQMENESSFDRASVIAKSFAGILERVYPEDYAEAIDFISLNPETETQLNLLLSIIQQMSENYAISADELVLGSNSQGDTELDLYVRILEDLPTFEQAKTELRDTYSRAQALGTRRVVPVVLRRIENV